MLALLAIAPQEDRALQRAPLAELAGVWDWSATFTAAPGVEPLVLAGRQRARLVLEGRWLFTEIVSSRAGVPIEGRSVLGCPGDSPALVGLSIGSTSTALRLGNGRYDAATRTFVLREARLDADGERRGYRIETRILAGGLEKKVWRSAAGAEPHLVARVTYTRRAEDSWSPPPSSRAGDHSHLEEWAGAWECRDSNGELGDLRERIICNGLWIESHAEWDSEEWRGFLAYERLTGRWNAVAFGRAGGLRTAEGQWDQSARALTLRGALGSATIQLSEDGKERTLELRGAGDEEARVIECRRKPEWKSLWNERDLSGWQVSLGAVDDHRKAHVPAAEEIFTVVPFRGAPALRVDGRISGSLISDESYSDYHLQLEFCWDEGVFEPLPFQGSGVLYHSFGEPRMVSGGGGPPNGPGPVTPGRGYFHESLEFQIAEAGKTGQPGYATAAGTLAPLGRISFERRGGAPRLQKPAGEWNRIDILCVADEVAHYLNGELTARIARARDVSGAEPRALTGGRLQLQSESSEIYFRKIRMRPASSLELRP